MRHILIGLALTTALSTASMAADIGVTLSNADTYMTVLRHGIERAGQDANKQVQIEIAEDDINKQISQVQNFIAAQVDAIIVTAVDSSATPVMTGLAKDAGIPIVYVNVQPGDIDQLGDRSAFVASDEVESGTLQTQEVCRLLREAGKTEAEVVVLMGNLAQFAAVQRTQDIRDVIATPECSFMKIIDEQTAMWDPIKGQDVMTNWISAGYQPDAVIANNDNMALGAITALKSVGTDMSQIIVAGIDATQEALAAMKAGDLDITVFQNAAEQGGSAVNTAIKLVNGEPVETRVWVPFELVTPENLDQYLNRN